MAFTIQRSETTVHAFSMAFAWNTGGKTPCHMDEP
jgi:hypothetical protein